MLTTNQKNNRKKLKALFQKELLNHTGDNSYIIMYFKHINNIVSELNFKDVSVEITPENNLKFIFIFSENKTIMITKTRVNIYAKKLIKEDINKVLFTIFDNRKFVLSGVITLQNFVTAFKDY
jgi:hypothetical protein